MTAKPDFNLEGDSTADDVPEGLTEMSGTSI